MKKYWWIIGSTTTPIGASCPMLLSPIFYREDVGYSLPAPGSDAPGGTVIDAESLDEDFDSGAAIRFGAWFPYQEGKKLLLVSPDRDPEYLDADALRKRIGEIREESIELAIAYLVQGDSDAAQRYAARAQRVSPQDPRPVLLRLRMKDALLPRTRRLLERKRARFSEEERKEAELYFDNNTLLKEKTSKLKRTFASRNRPPYLKKIKDDPRSIERTQKAWQLPQAA